MYNLFFIYSVVMLFSVAAVGLVISASVRPKDALVYMGVFAVYFISYLLYFCVGIKDPNHTDHTYLLIDVICLPLVYFSSFRLLKTTEKVEKMTISMVILFVFLVLSAIPLSLFGQMIPADYKALLTSLFVMSMLMVVVMIMVYRIYIKRLYEVGKNGIKGVADFPIHYLRHNMSILLCLTIVATLKFFSDSFLVLSILNVISSILLTGLLYSVFSTQTRALKTYENAARSKAKICGIPTQRYYEIKDQIRNEVILNKAFLDPDYSLDKLSDSLDCGRTYTSVVCTEEFGGFYDLVNRARLEYCDYYLQNHPRATQEELADACGFASRQALIYARKKLV